MAEATGQKADDGLVVIHEEAVPLGKLPTTGAAPANTRPLWMVGAACSARRRRFWSG